MRDLAYQVLELLHHLVALLWHLTAKTVNTARLFAARVVCKAQVAKAPIAAAAASLTSLIAAHPAFALVILAQCFCHHSGVLCSCASGQMSLLHRLMTALVERELARF